MSDLYGDAGGVAEQRNVVAGDLLARWRGLGGQPAPTTPAGLVGSVANRILVYTRGGTAETVADLLDVRRSGLVLTSPSASDGRRLLEPIGYDGPWLAEPARYERHAATPDRPFVLPDGFLEVSLEQVLDSQIREGATAAMTPTGFMRAGDTESLRVAAHAVQRLGRTDTIFVAPLDISLLGKRYIRQTSAILAHAGCPIGLILGKQGDPVAQSAAIIPNLRDLALSVPLMPIRTDFNAMDLVAHGAFAGAIGTGGSIRHAVDPSKKPQSFNPGEAPSVLFPHLVSWWKGSRIAKQYGARRAPRCPCVVCGGKPIDRFLYRSDREEALRHGVAVWMEMAVDMLNAATMRGRAQYWRNVCAGAVAEHKNIATQLQLVKPLKPQPPLLQWATLPAWPGSAQAGP